MVDMYPGYLDIECIVMLCIKYARVQKGQQNKDTFRSVLSNLSRTLKDSYRTSIGQGGKRWRKYWVFVCLIELWCSVSTNRAFCLGYLKQYIIFFLFF